VLTTINVAGKKIGIGEPCFIIAEAGVNHNGEYKQAKKLVDIAVAAGADAVKFQMFNPDLIVTDTATVPPYVEKNIGEKITQHKMLTHLALPYDEFLKLKDYCDQKNIIFLCTPHTYDAIDFLENIVPAYKFGSGDLTNIPALRHAAQKGKPMILGTGMATLDEIQDAITAINTEHNSQIIALHCTTNYPCPLEEVNLRAMQTMQNKLDCLVGYSDHTMGTFVPVLAVALGATVVEKHFTIDKNLPGPDHQASLEPKELTAMVQDIRNAEKVLGSGDKKPTASEQKLIRIVRKSIVATHDIHKGTVLDETMLSIKRPGTGLPPREFPFFIGKKTKRAIPKDEFLTKDMVEYT
jgi:N,N'-diacetyllegionaminate synthase